MEEANQSVTFIPSTPQTGASDSQVAMQTDRDIEL
jgi:hypothetical protein